MIEYPAIDGVCEHAYPKMDPAEEGRGDMEQAFHWWLEPTQEPITINKSVQAKKYKR